MMPHAINREETLAPALTACQLNTSFLLDKCCKQAFTLTIRVNE